MPAHGNREESWKPIYALWKTPLGHSDSHERYRFFGGWRSAYT